MRARAAAGNPAAWVVAGGVAAGTLDILFAWTYWAVKVGISFERILQSVAAGLLGDASYRGGGATAALGLALHLGIATTMALAYFLAARRRPALARHWAAGGAGYGLVLYGVMNYVVVPLSAAGPGSKDPLWVGLGILAHVVLIGLPIGYGASRGVGVAEGPGGGWTSGRRAG